jgi:8-oxo-dGTP pyrophosphatase MutT (NUDIX family)
LDQLAAPLAGALAARARAVLECPEKTVAAVLVPLLAVGGEAHLLFTRRSAALPHHQGQVAFPGGTTDPRDADLAATALREAHEEIGLLPSDARVLGALDDLETVSSRFVITPFVATVPHPYAWTPSPHEVDAIFTVPLRVLADPAAGRQEVWDFAGRHVPIDLIAVGEHVIWGVTHRITRNLLAVLADLP